MLFLKNICLNFKDLFIRFCVYFVDCVCVNFLQVDIFLNCEINMDGVEDVVLIYEFFDFEVFEVDFIFCYIWVLLFFIKKRFDFY